MNNKKGFTLIEMMVAVTVFTVVALIISGAFVTMAGVFKKVQANRVVVDNINFAMDTMTLQIREGKNYIFSSPIILDDCDSCYSAIQFDEYVMDNNVYRPNRKIKYELDPNVGSITQCSADYPQDPINCTSLTSPEIFINDFVVGSLFSGNEFGDLRQRELVVLLLNGVAFAGRPEETDFSLQTILFQRND